MLSESQNKNEAQKLLKAANELKQAGKLEDATTKYLIALDLYPNFAWLHYLLGDTLAKSCQWERAVECLCKAIELRPNSQLFQQKLESLSKDFFDENLYLQANEDVRIAVSNGQLNSGYEHWLKFGRHEKQIGTRLCYKKQDRSIQHQAQASFNNGSLYDNFYYKYCCGGPECRHGNEHFEQFFDSVAKTIVKTLKPKTVLDVGCSVGFLVSKLRKLDVEAFGVDVSEYAISQVPSDIKPYCWIGSATQTFPNQYDLMVCIEVLEHMPAVDSLKSLENMCSKTNAILFSSSPHDYKEATHFNVQPPEVWASLFAKHGFFRDIDFDASFVCPWAALYRKTNIKDIDKTVKAYERKLGLLGRENSALRESLVELQQQLFLEIESRQNTE
jgi:predicted TPR repeat methyltransferase